MSPPLAIETQNLGRIYKLHGPKRRSEPDTLVALADVNLEISQGELFGLLGPNGAGKTTLIKILATLLLPSSGHAFVAGHDVVTAASAIRHHTSMVSGGETSGYGLLTVEENLWMFARFYGLDSAVARRRIERMLEVVGIGDRRHSKISDLSTGLRQKMNFVRGFISDPDVLFLDEPTLGLDVGAARDVRSFVKTWMQQHPDRTILLTTHYMAEADELCDRVAIIDRGRVLACDTPANLKWHLQKEAIFNLKISPLGPRPDRDDMIEAVPGVQRVTIAEKNSHTDLNLILEREEVLAQVLAHLTRRGAGLISLDKRAPTLEDVFVELVGRGLDVDTSRRTADLDA